MVRDIPERAARRTETGTTRRLSEQVDYQYCPWRVSLSDRRLGL